MPTKKPNESILEKRRKLRSKNRGSGDTADYAALPADVMLALIAAVTGLGISITFGYTRDGGAYYLSLYHEGESDRIYIRPNEDPEDQLRALVSEFENL